MFKEHLVFIHVLIASAPISDPIVDLHPIATSDDEPIEEVDSKSLDVIMDMLEKCSKGNHLYHS